MLRPDRAPRAKAAVLLAIVCAAGCTTTDRDDGGSLQHYTVRGEIVRLPEPSRPDGADIYLRHEAIPDFVDADGEAVGMEAMTMPFALARGIDLSGLSVGDQVTFDLEVRWEGLPPAQVTRIERLAAQSPGEPGDAPAGEETSVSDEPAPDATAGHEHH